MLAELAPNLFIHESIVRFFGAPLPTRMTVVRLGDGRLFVHSPARLDDTVRAALDALGPVAFVVSPNKLHNQGIGDYAAAYPQATTFASPGLVERRPDVHFDAVLGERPEPQWAADLDQAATAGNAFMSEIVFFHRSTRTLIVADLIENIHAETLPAFWRSLMRFFGGTGRPLVSPELRLYTTDADAAEAALRRILHWDYQRVILAHGRLIQTDAKRAVETACAEMLATARRRSALARRLLAATAKLQ